MLLAVVINNVKNFCPGFISAREQRKIGGEDLLSTEKTSTAHAQVLLSSKAKKDSNHILFLAV